MSRPAKAELPSLWEWKLGPVSLKANRWFLRCERPPLLCRSEDPQQRTRGQLGLTSPLHFAMGAEATVPMAAPHQLPNISGGFSHNQAPGHLCFNCTSTQGPQIVVPFPVNSDSRQSWSTGHLSQSIFVEVWEWVANQQC